MSLDNRVAKFWAFISELRGLAQTKLNSVELNILFEILLFSCF